MFVINEETLINLYNPINIHYKDLAKILENFLNFQAFDVFYFKNQKFINETTNVKKFQDSALRTQGPQKSTRQSNFILCVYNFSKIKLFSNITISFNESSAKFRLSNKPTILGKVILNL